MTLPKSGKLDLAWNEVSQRVPTVLVVDDDPRLLALVHGWLDGRGFLVTCAETSAGALTTAQSTVVDMALVDYRLRGREDGLSLGRTLLCEHGIPFVLISLFLKTPVTVQAMKLGASNVLDKPLTEERLVKAINQAISGDSGDRQVSSATSADEFKPVPWPDDDSPPRRLARFVLRGCEAGRDPKTVLLFAKTTVVSPAVFRAACKLCGVKPRDVCGLGRILRAVSLSIQDNSPITSHFWVGDERTAKRLMSRAGMEPATRRIELRDLLNRQNFVNTDLEFLHELAHLAANSPLFFPRDE